MDYGRFFWLQVLAPHSQERLRPPPLLVVRLVTAGRGRARRSLVVLGEGEPVVGRQCQKCKDAAHFFSFRQK